MRKFLDGGAAAELTDNDRFSDWQVGSEYKVVRFLGQGSYGSVVEAIHTPT